MGNFQETLSRPEIETARPSLFRLQHLQSSNKLAKVLTDNLPGAEKLFPPFGGQTKGSAFASRGGTSFFNHLNLGKKVKKLKSYNVKLFLSCLLASPLAYPTGFNPASQRRH